MRIILAALVVGAVAILAGCGGGGGGSAPPDQSSFTITGTVTDTDLGVAVVGARVTTVVGQTTYQATINSSGRFTLTLPSAPTVTTYIVDGTSAHAANGDSSIQYGTETKSFPSNLTSGTDLTVHLTNLSSPPPPPS